MRVGIPDWNGEVSPVLDTAVRLVIVETGAGAAEARREAVIAATALPARAAELRGLGVDVLICGAVSRGLAALLAASGVRLVPWISGPVDEVLEAWMDGRLGARRFAMPGCCGRGGAGRHGRRGRGGPGGGRRNR
jgi:predicted Fe-Mo cluster-binding NifX family protein